MMNRAKYVIPLLFVAVSMATIQPGAVRSVSAESTPLVVVVADAQALHQTEDAVDVAASFIGLLSTLQGAQRFVFVGGEDPSRQVGPFSASDPDYDESRARILTLLGTVDEQSAPLAGLLLEAQAVLSREQGAPGSEVYVITGDSVETDFGQLAVQLSPLAGRFDEFGWTINGVELPNASAESVLFLEGLASESAGRVIDLSGTDALMDVADSLLGRVGRGSLSALGRRDLDPAELMSSAISIVPGTSETTIMLFRDDTVGEMQLSDPLGFGVSAFDQSKFQIVETPHAIIWRLIDPEPGNWRVDVTGMNGGVSVWRHTENDYSLALIANEPVPLNEPAAILAYVQRGDQPVNLEDVRMYANITTPEGSRVTLEMMDDGIGSDAVEGDGSFTLTLPPLLARGEYQVELELDWLTYNHRISSLTSFSTSIFPGLLVTAVDFGELEPGARTHVANVVVHVDGQPYPVNPETLTANLNSTEDEPGIIELVPMRVYGDGPAFEYDVFLTAPDYGRFSVSYLLDTEYAGRVFQHSTDAAFFIVEPPVAVAEVVTDVVADLAPAVTLPSAVQSLPVPFINDAPSGFPMLAVWIPIGLLVVLGAAASWVLTRTRPYGFIYDDQDDPLVDFAAIRRHPVLELLLRGSIKGNELGLPGLEGVVFRFSKGQIQITSQGDHPTVRVNNQPLVGQTTIEDRTWIGTGGKLYTFLLSPPSPMLEGSGD